MRCLRYNNYALGFTRAFGFTRARRLACGLGGER